MNVARWIVGGGLIGVGALLSALNWRIFWLRHVRRTSAASWVPLLAGLVAAGGLLLIPNESARRLWWLPFLLDWGGAPGLIYTASWHLHRLGRRSSTR